MSKPQCSVLFLTLSEYGQANTILALASELISRPNTEGHIASFTPLEKRVNEIQSQASSKTRVSPLYFHTIPGRTWKEVAADNGFILGRAHPPSTKSLECFNTFDVISAPWDGEEYVRLVEDIKGVVKSVDADIIVVDMLFSAAAEACRLLERRYMINSPLQAYDTLRGAQPRVRGLWAYPGIGSDSAYPLSWSAFVKNIWININMVMSFLNGPHITAHRKTRMQAGFPGPVSQEAINSGEVKVLCPSIPETDWPGIVYPPFFSQFGPIVLDSSPLAEADPELLQWLETPGTRTLVISMGSHFEYPDAVLKAFLDGLVAGIPDDVQVLWKVGSDKQTPQKVERLLEQHASGKRLDLNRWRLVNWMKADPYVIMNHTNVAAYVHHGGANTYFECCLAGVPQIILPQWYDTYENASKADYRGFGIFGNRTCAPGVDAVEFGAAIARILGTGDEGQKFRAKARDLSVLCHQAGGRKAAVDAIILEAKEGKALKFSH